MPLLLPSLLFTTVVNNDNISMLWWHRVFLRSIDPPLLLKVWRRLHLARWRRDDVTPMAPMTLGGKVYDHNQPTLKMDRIISTHSQTQPPSHHQS